MSKNTPEMSTLGQSVYYKDQYDPNILFPIPRITKREEIGLTDQLPFEGVDIWNAYEVSWLNSKGLPRVAIVEFYIDSQSENIIESKSFKLYLNSFNQTKFESLSAVKETLTQDIQSRIKGSVEVIFRDVDQYLFTTNPSFTSQCIDHEEIDIQTYSPKPGLLNTSEQQVEERLHSHLLKSNCLVTGQPDWASIYIHYIGPKIIHSSLLKYLVSFRNHNEFHEQCVERIFTDILTSAKPNKLSVYARYTRRGGLDINPFRSNFEEHFGNFKLARQ